MSLNAEDALRYCGAILGARIAARAEPVAQQAVERLIALGHHFQNVDRTLQTGGGRHVLDIRTARKITAAPSSVMIVVAARGCR